MEIWKNMAIYMCIILLSIALLIAGTRLNKQKQEITNLENKVNYVIWERDYIDHALEDNLKQY